MMRQESCFPRTSVFWTARVLDYLWQQFHLEQMDQGFMVVVLITTLI